MPRSKRAKVVPLTRTTKKGKVGKGNLIQEIQDSLEQFHFVYLFELHNSRNTLLKEVRTRFTTSKFFFGKIKVIQHALGKDEQSEYKPNMRFLSNRMGGLCGILMTNEPQEMILQFFRTYSVEDYARSGFVSTKTIELPAGPLPQFSHAMEPFLRQLGMPTELKNAVISLRTNYTVCTEGQALTPDQARIVKLLEVKMSAFRFHMLCCWNDGKYTSLGENTFSDISAGADMDIPDEDDDGEAADDND